MSNADKINILKAEYKVARDNPVFDAPSYYCILLNLIQDEIEKLGGKL